MNMGVITILAIFVISLVTTALKGPGWTFVCVYLPTLLFFSQLPTLLIPHVPMLSYSGPILAILIVWPFTKHSLSFKINSVDVIIGLLVISATMTAVSNGLLETVINNFRNEILRIAAPYFIARAIFRATDMRRMALNILIISLGITGIFALIEFRVQPYFYIRTLRSLGYSVPSPIATMSRYGFFRVFGTAEHPIYFGNMAVVLLGMVAVLAKSTGAGLKNIWVQLALVAALGCVVVSISFTPYVGLIGGACLLAVLMFMPFTRYLMVPILLAVIVAVFAFTYHVAHSPLGDQEEGDLNGSYHTRKIIITQSWKKAVGAGAFGYGENLESDDDFNLESVDNSYMLFTMRFGYVYTILWLSLGVAYAVRLTRAFIHISHRSQVFPLAAGAGTIFAILLSMYTVWSGAVYLLVWIMMLALSNTLIDLVLYPELRTEKVVVKQARVRVLQATPPGGLALPGLRVARVASK